MRRHLLAGYPTWSVSSSVEALLPLEHWTRGEAGLLLIRGVYHIGVHQIELLTLERTYSQLEYVTLEIISNTQRTEFRYPEAYLIINRPKTQLKQGA